MKKFTCKEIMNNEGGCDMQISGETPMDVASQCREHVTGSIDEAHKLMREKMLDPNHTQADREKWFIWFQGEWNKKKDQ